MIEPEVVGNAVLRDFPLRLWARSMEHSDELLREFTLILQGTQIAPEDKAVPDRILAIAEEFTAMYGPTFDAVQEERQEAFDAGIDRIDSTVPMLKDIPQLLSFVRGLSDEVDEYCRRGDLLALARPPDLVAFGEWQMNEMERQYEGGEPAPWTGPF